MSAERVGNSASEKMGASLGREFTRKFTNTLCELRLSMGIAQRIEKLLEEFAEEHPSPRGTYISRNVDDSYFNDGSCGWEATAKPKLHGLVLESDKIYEFLAFANGLRTYVSPLETVMNIEELWLEPGPNQPFILRACLFHSFPATTILYAPDGESQDAAVAFLRRVKYLRGF
ncbi:MAG TPA: hypothetical protein VKU00_03795 [Chthonomonadaceae bacterium]|nr:hypothetical protein [Chthonomonadaceae bacterium]